MSDHAAFLAGGSVYRWVQVKCTRCPKDVVGAVFEDEGTGRLAVMYVADDFDGSIVHRQLDAVEAIGVRCTKHGPGSIPVVQLRAAVQSSRRRNAQRGRRHTDTSDVVRVVCGHR